MSQQGFFKRPWGAAESSQDLQLLQAEWDNLAQRIRPPADSRPDHVRLYFFQISWDLEAFLRKWTPLAESQPQLQKRLQTAQQSLQNLLNEAKSAFEASERQRVEAQRLHDQQRWAQLHEQKRQAEQQAHLRQTEREIQAIYDDIRAQQQKSQQRQHAMWRAAHFPETTCACGRSKMPHHLWCWDCAPGRSTP